MSEMKADKVIDGRGLEPPEPFLLTMEALDAIQPGQTVLLLLSREPFPLYRALELNGYAWQTERKDDGTVEILIWHKPAKWRRAHPWSAQKVPAAQGCGRRRPWRLRQPLIRSFSKCPLFYLLFKPFFNAGRSCSARLLRCWSHIG